MLETSLSKPPVRSCRNCSLRPARLNQRQSWKTAVAAVAVVVVTAAAAVAAVAMVVIVAVADATSEVATTGRLAGKQLPVTLIPERSRQPIDSLPGAFRSVPAPQE